MPIPFEAPDVTKLWASFRPRFLASGVEPLVIDRLQEKVGHWGQWCDAWCEEGERMFAWAERAHEQGRLLTAGGLWTRASILFHFGGMIAIDDMEQFRSSHARAVEAYALGGPLLEVPTQRVEADFDGVVLPGYLRIPRTDVPPPVVLFVNGWEGTKEEMEWTIQDYHARGMATLTWDGPGRGEVWDAVPMTGDYGPAASAMIDLLETRSDIDPNRIGVMGPSKGGFHAATIAAHDPRIKAAALIGPGYDRRLRLWGMEIETAFMIELFHLETADELEERLSRKDLTLEGVPERITCPTLVVTDDLESESQFGGSSRLYEELAGPKVLEVVSGCGRNGYRLPHVVKPLGADFLAEKLGS